MVKRHPAVKAISVAMLLIAIVALVFLLMPLWLKFIYPFLALLLFLAAMAVLCTRSTRQGVLGAFGNLAQLFLGAATITAVYFVLMFFLLPKGDLLHWRLSDGLEVASLFVPQLLWFQRLRANPLAALFVAIGSVGPTISFLNDF